MRVKDSIILRGDIPDYLIQRGVKVKRIGNEYRCPCPIHHGTRGDSFCCSSKKWYCFSCCEGGSIIELHMALENVSYIEAIYQLANLYDIEIDSNEEYQKTKSYFDEQESIISKAERERDKIIEYLKKKRNLSDETIYALRYGFDPSNGNIIIPIRNSDGMIVAKAVRTFAEGVPKYLNDKNNEYYAKGETLYNFDRAKKKMKKQKKLYLCEGYFDVASADDDGLACCGYNSATLTQNQIKLLVKELDEFNKDFVIMFAPDNDDEGQKRVPLIRDKFKQWGSSLNVRVVRIPDGYKDFSDLHVAGVSIEDLPSEHIDVFCCMQGIEDCPDRETEYTYALEYLRTVRNPLIRTEIAEKLAQRWGKRVEDITNFANGGKSETSLLKDFKQPLDAVQELRDLLNNGKIGVGFNGIDTSIGKLRKSEVVVLCAYSSVGKTFFAIEMALHCAFREKRNVIFFSMEMSASTLICRLIAMFLKKTEDEVEVLLQQGDNEALLVQNALNKHLYIIDKNNLTVEEMRQYINVANTMVFETPVDMVIVDYLQYMPNTSKYEVMSETIRSFKPLAKEMNIIPVVLSQLNREGRTWEKPQLHQIKGGGDIESTADFVFGMWRESENPALSLSEQEAIKDNINFSILKARRKCKKRDFQLYFNPTETYFYEKNI